jgi:hypothetical protein
VGLEWGPLSLLSTSEELLGRTISGSGLEDREGIRCADHATLSIRKKLALTSPTSGGHSVGIVRSWTKGHGESFMLLNYINCYYVKKFRTAEYNLQKIL